MSLTAELISVGTELLLGSILNTNARFLSRELSALGVNVYHQTVVGDNPQRLRDAVELARARADVLITTGGLGPTCDDLTKTTLAQVYGRELVFDPESAQRVRAYFGRLHQNTPMPENNLQQAQLPQGAIILPNDWGTAPGCILEDPACTAILLPGPPSECEPMFRAHVLPYLQRRSGEVIVSRSLRIFGLGESAVEAMLRSRMNAMENPTLAPYAKVGEVELRLTAKAPDKAAASVLLDPAENELRAILGDVVYGTDVDSLEQAAAQALKAKHLTFGCAESCTGGLIAQRLTNLPGVSAVFKGGLVTYCNDAKERLLGVPHEMLDRYGAVSCPVAQAMAQGARAALGCDIAAATTGVAGPDRDDRGNPVGLVYVALATPDGVFCRETHLGEGRARVRTTAAHHAFDMLRRYLSGLPVCP